jgi:hypothetical protein
MQAPPGPRTAPPVLALLRDGALAGEWVLAAQTREETDERPSGHR